MISDGIVETVGCVLKVENRVFQKSDSDMMEMQRVGHSSDRAMPSSSSGQGAREGGGLRTKGMSPAG